MALGLRMNGACSTCGTTGHPTGARFCFQCGGGLDAGIGPSAPTRSYTPPHLRSLLSAEVQGGERKDVTVLLADVVGSLAMSASLDPEDVHAVMNAFFAIANEAVHAEGGRVNQYRGDGFMALFGAPHAVSDNATRACRAALRIRDDTERYAESVRARFGQPLVLRMGLNTGLVWVGSIGTGLREDYTAEGPTVGIAARAETIALPGQVLVAEETARRAHIHFEWAELGARAMKGLEDPVRVFELLRESPLPGRLAAERAQGFTPFVPRTEELSELAALCRASGVRAVEIRGEAGSGKSRLALELLEGMAGVRVLELDAREPARGRAFDAWLDLLTRLPGEPPLPDELVEARARLQGADPAADRKSNVAGLLRRGVEQLVASEALVVLVDGAQWLDPSSRGVIRDLLERPPEGDLLFLATLREGEGEEDWGSSHSRRLDLAPLQNEQALALASSALGDVADAEQLAELAALRGGGNPLFIEELARSLGEASASMRRAARLELALEREPGEIPRTLHGVVASRIDALSRDEKRALEVAAVLGQPFDPELLSELGVDAVAHVDPLIARGLLRRLSTHELDFRHGVVREVAQAQLVRARLRELHARAARALEARPLAASAAGAARIGNHFDAAGEVERAAEHLLRAGRLHARLDAPAEAALLLRRGLELRRAEEDPDPAELAESSLVLAICLNALDRPGEAGVVLEGIDEAQIGDEDRSRLAESLVHVGWVRFSERGELEEARDLIERGMALAQGRPGAQRTLTMAHNFLARLCILDGDVARGIRETRRVIELAAARGDTVGEVLGLHNRSQVHCDAGDLVEARQAAERALELATGRTEPMIVAMVTTALARVHLFEGDPNAAMEQADAGRRAALRAAQVGIVYAATMIQGYAQLLDGRPRAARERFEALSELDQGWPSTEMHRARGFLEVGELDAAVELGSQCLKRAPTRLVRARATAIRGLATGLRSPLDADEAERALAESISLFDRLGLRPYRAESHEFLADLLAHVGDTERAGYYAARAASGYGECGMLPQAVRARRLLEQAGRAS